MRTLLSAPPTDRVGRYPKHTFQVQALPFTAQPFFFARVLPGETMQNLFMESRVISDPILNPIIGWKKQYFFYYVRMTDLLLESAKEMFVDPTNTDLTATLGIGANDQHYYTAKGGIDWLKRAVTRVIETWFRDEGETAAAHAVSGVPIVQIREQTFMDSLTDKDDMPEGEDIAEGQSMRDLEALMNAFEQLRALGIADMTYEDWLRSNGIAIPNKDENKPEEIALFSDFQYPSNTVDPTTGIPASAVSYVFKNGQRKPFRFKEPGFLVGLSVTRPKVYFGGLAGMQAAHAGRAWDWMPNYLREMPETALKYFTAGTGPLGDRSTDTDAYFLDMRDGLIHGDQFQNMVPFPANSANPTTVGANHLLALPDVNLNWKYPTEAMCKSFFVDSAGTKTFIRQDGYVSLHIRGFEVDYTQGNFAQA